MAGAPDGAGAASRLVQLETLWRLPPRPTLCRRPWSGDEGAIYEGTTTANTAGNWTLNKPAGFSGPNLTATATDAAGSSSEFSAPVHK